MNQRASNAIKCNIKCNQMQSNAISNAIKCNQMQYQMQYQMQSTTLTSVGGAAVWTCGGACEWTMCISLILEMNSDAEGERSANKWCSSKTMAILVQFAYKYYYLRRLQQLEPKPRLDRWLEPKPRLDRWLEPKPRLDLRLDEEIHGAYQPCKIVSAVKKMRGRPPTSRMDGCAVAVAGAADAAGPCATVESIPHIHHLQT